MRNKAIIVSGFPGIGKTYLFENYHSIKILDSDSSKFPKDQLFIANYMQHINENLDKADVICVSTHKEVRAALVKHGIHFILVYPQANLRSEYIERYHKRGSSKTFINLLNKMWTQWIRECSGQKSCTHIRLSSGEYLSNSVDKWLSSGEYLSNSVDKWLSSEENNVEVSSTDPLVGFLYYLMRDHLPLGVIEQEARNTSSEKTVFNNGWLARYAIELATRLKETS